APSTKTPTPVRAPSSGVASTATRSMAREPIEAWRPLPFDLSLMAIGFRRLLAKDRRPLTMAHVSTRRAAKSKATADVTSVAEVIVALCGGVGAARFLRGLLAVVPQSDVAAVVNTGDDIILHGLHISPDLETVTYTLAD